MLDGDGLTVMRTSVRMPWLLCPRCRRWSEPQRWDRVTTGRIAQRCPECGDVSDPSEVEMRIGERPPEPA
jgi:hypothetical protein